MKKDSFKKEDLIYFRDLRSSIQIKETIQGYDKEPKTMYQLYNLLAREFKEIFNGNIGAFINNYKKEYEIDWYNNAIKRIEPETENASNENASKTGRKKIYRRKKRSKEKES